MRTEGVGEFATPLVVTFAEAATLDHSELGAKAANLACLASVGFPVPPGFAVRTTAERYQREASAKILDAAAALLQSRGHMITILWNALIRVNSNTVAADRAVLGRLADQWRTEILPRYRTLVTTAQERVQWATPAQLAGIVEEVGTAAGE